MFMRVTAVLILTTRDGAKTFVYALMYGAGNAKLGRILFDNGAAINGVVSERKLQSLGKAARLKYEAGFPGLSELRRDLAKGVGRGYFIGLDGRRLYGLSKHNSLNTLLQSAGGVVAKKALVLLDSLAQEAGLIPGEDYEFCANSHDETQSEVRPQHAEQYGQLAVRAMELAGEHYNLRCPISGEYKVGSSWKETH